MIAVIYLLLFILFLLVAYWYYYFNYCNKYMKTIPGPKIYPIVGYALEFSDSRSFLQVPFKLYRQFGGTVKVMMGFEMNLMVGDYKMMEFFLTSNKLIDKGRFYNYYHRWLGTGLLTSTGQKYRKRRKMITPAYHFNILEEFINIFDKNSNILIEQFQKEVNKGSTDIYPYMTACALDNICETAMGTSVHALTDNESEYARSVKRMCKILMERSFSPIQQFHIFYRFTKNYKEENALLKVLHNYTLNIITQRRKQLHNSEKQVDHHEDEFGQKKRIAFLDLLLKSTIDGQPLTDEDIREEVDTFMFEGHDTVTSALSFTIFSIATNPDVQAKIVEEQKKIFGDDPTRMPTLRDLQEMKYLELVNKESLRMYPSVPIYGRELKEDLKYSDDIIVRKGTQIGIMPYNVHRDPSVFPDPEKFDPERFADGSLLSKYPYAYIPFSAGPRNCIGQKFAALEMKAVISKVIRNFELLPVVPAHKLDLVAETILKSANGMLVQVKARKW